SAILQLLLYRVLLHEARHVHERPIHRAFADQPLTLPRLHAKDVEASVDLLELGSRAHRRANAGGRAMRHVDMRPHGGLTVFLKWDRRLVARELHPADHIRRRQYGRENVVMVLEGVLELDFARDLRARADRDGLGHESTLAKQPNLKRVTFSRARHVRYLLQS